MSEFMLPMRQLMGGFYTSVLLGEQSASKTDADHPDRRCPVRILTLVLHQWLRTADVARLRKASALRCSVSLGGIMLVRIQSSAL